MSSSVTLFLAAGLLIGFASKRGPKAPRAATVAPIPQSAWRLEAGPLILLEPTRRYAAILELSFPDSLASTERIGQELMKYARWFALDVYDDANDVPANFPRPTPLSNTVGRRFAIGDPDVTAGRQTFKRPPQIAALWSRERPK